MLQDRGLALTLLQLAVETASCCPLGCCWPGAGASHLGRPPASGLLLGAAIEIGQFFVASGSQPGRVGAEPGVGLALRRRAGAARWLVVAWPGVRAWRAPLCAPLLCVYLPAAAVRERLVPRCVARPGRGGHDLGGRAAAALLLSLLHRRGGGAVQPGQRGADVPAAGSAGLGARAAQAGGHARRRCSRWRCWWRRASCSSAACSPDPTNLLIAVAAAALALQSGGLGRPAAALSAARPRPRVPRGAGQPARRTPAPRPRPSCWSCPPPPPGLGRSPLFAGRLLALSSPRGRDLVAATVGPGHRPRRPAGAGPGALDRALLLDGVRPPARGVPGRGLVRAPAARVRRSAIPRCDPRLRPAGHQPGRQHAARIAALAPDRRQQPSPATTAPSTRCAS